MMTFIQSRIETVIYTTYNFRVSRRSPRRFAHCAIAPFAPLRSIRSIRAAPLHSRRSANFAKFTINLDCNSDESRFILH